MTDNMEDVVMTDKAVQQDKVLARPMSVPMFIFDWILTTVLAGTFVFAGWTPQQLCFVDGVDYHVSLVPRRVVVIPSAKFDQGALEVMMNPGWNDGFDVLMGRILKACMQRGMQLRNTGMKTSLERLYYRITAAIKTNFEDWKTDRRKDITNLGYGRVGQLTVAVFSCARANGNSDTYYVIDGFMMDTQWLAAAYAVAKEVFLAQGFSAKKTKYWSLTWCIRLLGIAGGWGPESEIPVTAEHFGVRRAL